MFRRITLERCLILVSAFAWMAITNQTTEALYTHKKFKGNKNGNAGANSNSKNVCLSEVCVNTAKEVLAKMKTEVEPCDDFYQFACGNYIDKAEIPKDKVSLNTFSLISDKLLEQLKDIITEERPETDPKHFRLPNLLYKACMNKSQIETVGTNPIKRIYKSLGGWPLIEGNLWNSDNKWTWQETVKKCRRLGFSANYIVSLSIGENLKNGTKRILYLAQSSIGMRRGFFLKGFNETMVLAYYDYMVDISVLFGAEKKAAEKELKEVLQFEIDLAMISWPKEQRRDPNKLYNLRTIKQLQENYPYVQWLDYINAFLPEGVNVDESEVIILTEPSFFDDLGKLLQRTKQRVIANYMIWRIYATSVSYLTEDFRKREMQYSSALSGKKERTPRWKECVGVVSGSLHISVGSLYVRKHFHQDSKAIALEMVDNIRNVFSQILDDIKWMDDMTKQQAKKKLHAMTPHIGYPEEMLDNSKLEELFRKLEIDPDKYLESSLNMSVFGTDYAFNQLRLPVNKTDWIRHSKPAIVNAFYSLTENSIQFPAGILQGHFYNAQRPKYMNYGAIGFVIGHEITHGFDDGGHHFDLEGNLIDWWQPDTKKAYLEKVKCIIEQYGNFTEEKTGLKVNGFNTQGENIADNGGVKQSYLAYNQWAKNTKNGEEPKLPGLNYTPNQMFWISAAQIWCSKQRTESLKIHITTDSHSPDKFRVLGSFRNLKYFSFDFQCPEGAPMNPMQKCEVW